MIIMESLYNMAMAEGLDYYRPFVPKRIDFAIPLTKSGHRMGLMYPDGGPWSDSEKWKALYLECLRDADRSSGTSSMPLYDCPKYIFPSFKHDGPSGDKSDAMREDFRNKVQMIFDNTNDEAVKAVLLYLDRLASGKEVFPTELDPKKSKSKWFTFYYLPTNEYVMYRPSVRDFWKTYFLKDSIPGDKHQCCVTGRFIEAVSPSYPKSIGMPGSNGGGARLASTNKDAFKSFGLESNENFPYDREAIEVISIALTRMFSNFFPSPGGCYPDHTQQKNHPLPNRSLFLGKNTMFCFWSDSSTLQFAEDIPALLEADPDSLKEQTWIRMLRGEMPSQPGDIGHHDCEYIYGTIFTGADRPVFHSVMMYPVLDFQRNMTQHFIDTKVSRTASRKNENLNLAFGIKKLLFSCTAAAKEGESKEPPPRISVSYTQAVLDGSPYPAIVASQAAARYPKEFHNSCNKKKTWFWRHRMDCCAAIIKGYMNRQIRLGKTTTKKEFTEHMDHTRTDPAYALGCSLAIANSLQRNAHGSLPNKGIAEDLFTRCKSTPIDGYEKISEKVIHYIAKIRRRELPWGLYLTRVWNFWQSNIGGNLPNKFDDEQRHAFLLGFHQTYAWISDIDLRTKWLKQDGVPEILKPRNHEQKSEEESEFQKEDIDIPA